MSNPKIEKIKSNNCTALKINGSFTRMYHYTNPGNCKLTTYDKMNAYLPRYEEEVVEYIKKTSKITFFINVNDRKYVDILKKHFKLIYCVKVPIGYGRNYQYHALFSRTKSYPSKYRKRLEYHSNRKKLENIIEV